MIPAEPLLHKPKGCTNLKLRQLMRSTGQFYDAELRKVDLKVTQFSLLSHVLKLGPLRPTDLASASKLDVSTLTRNLKLLVDAGWITLSPGVDARSRLVTITEAGKEKCHEAQRKWRAAQDQVTALLGHDNVLALHALIDKAMARLATGAPASGGDD